VFNEIKGNSGCVFEHRKGAFFKFSTRVPERTTEGHYPPSKENAKGCCQMCNIKLNC